MNKLVILVGMIAVLFAFNSCKQEEDKKPNDYAKWTYTTSVRDLGSEDIVDSITMIKNHKNSTITESNCKTIEGLVIFGVADTKEDVSWDNITKNYNLSAENIKTIENYLKENSGLYFIYVVERYYKLLAIKHMQ